MGKQENLFFDENERQKNAIVINREGSGVTPQEFDSLAWVLRARSKDERRMHLCGLHSDGMGEFVATDGHRLHIAEIPGLTEKIPEGIWIYVHSTKTQISILEAPEGMAAYPSYKMVSGLSVDHENKGSMMYLGSDTDSLWRFWDLVGVKCNIDYLMDILEGVDGLDVFAAPEPLSGIFFISRDEFGNTKKAILMPLKDQKKKSGRKKEAPEAAPESASNDVEKQEPEPGTVVDAKFAQDETKPATEETSSLFDEPEPLATSTYRIRNTKNNDWWEGQATSAADACDQAGWNLLDCEIKVKNETGSWCKAREAEPASVNCQPCEYHRRKGNVNHGVTVPGNGGKCIREGGPCQPCPNPDQFSTCPNLKAGRCMDKIGPCAEAQAA
jgi:hypothetical protein